MRLQRSWTSTFATAAALTVVSQHVPAAGADATAAPDTQACSSAGLKLPAGFCATVFADEIGAARHLAVAPNGVVYVNTWSGRRQLYRHYPHRP